MGLHKGQTNNPDENIYNWDPSDEQSVEWLETASKLLTKSDLNTSIDNITLNDNNDKSLKTEHNIIEYAEKTNKNVT